MFLFRWFGQNWNFMNPEPHKTSQQIIRDLRCEVLPLRASVVPPNLARGFEAKIESPNVWDSTLEQVKYCHDTDCNEPMMKTGFTALKIFVKNIKTPSEDKWKPRNGLLRELRKPFEKVAQDEAEKVSAVQEIMLGSTGYLRRITAPVGGQGWVTVSHLCPHCNSCPLNIWWVSGWKDTKWWSAICGAKYDWKQPNRLLVVQRGDSIEQAKVFKARAVPQVFSANLISALKLLANQQEDGDGFVKNVVKDSSNESRKGLTDGLREFIKVDNERALDVGPFRMGTRTFQVRKAKVPEGCPEVIVRESLDEMTLSAEGVGTLKALISVDHIDRETWGPPLVDVDWCAFCQALYKGIEGEDWCVVEQLGWKETWMMTRCSSSGYMDPTTHIALFLQDWVVTKVALSCHIALDMLCQEMHAVVTRRGWFGFWARLVLQKRGRKWMTSPSELSWLLCFLWIFWNVACVWNEGVPCFLLCHLCRVNSEKVERGLDRLSTERLPLLEGVVSPLLQRCASIFLCHRISPETLRHRLKVQSMRFKVFKEIYRQHRSHWTVGMKSTSFRFKVSALMTVSLHRHHPSAEMYKTQQLVSYHKLELTPSCFNLKSMHCRKQHHNWLQLRVDHQRASRKTPVTEHNSSIPMASLPLGSAEVTVTPQRERSRGSHF